MKKTLIEGGLWGVAGLVWWLAPPPWKNLWYVFVGLAMLVAVLGFIDSRRRLKKATEAVEKTKRELEELRKKT